MEFHLPPQRCRHQPLPTTSDLRCSFGAPMKLARCLQPHSLGQGDTGVGSRANRAPAVLRTSQDGPDFLAVMIGVRLLHRALGSPQLQDRVAEEDPGGLTHPGCLP